MREYFLGLRRKALSAGAIAAGAIVAGAVFPGPAVSAPVAGQAVDAVPDAELVSKKVKVVIVRGTAVTSGDRIVTDAKGLVQLVFSDDTRLVVGPRSSLVIESYLLRSNNSANDFTVRVLGGSFRMITGNSRKQAYRIKTPTATIGVRGTEFDFSVQRDGTTQVVLFNGSATVCGDNGSCQILNRACSMVQAAPKRDVRKIEDKTTRANQINQNFPHVLSQYRLRREFRVSLSGCELTRPPREKDRFQQERVRDARVAPTPPPTPAEPSALSVTITGPRSGDAAATVDFNGGRPSVDTSTQNAGSGLTGSQGGSLAGSLSGGLGTNVEVRGVGSVGRNTGFEFNGGSPLN